MTCRRRASVRSATFVLFLAATSLSAATITVNSTADTAADDGKCTLREAIAAANNDAASGASTGECAAGSGADTIQFAIPAAEAGCNASGVCTFKPASDLPVISHSLTIDGYTQSGAAVNTLAQGTNAKLKIVIDGSLDPGFTPTGFVVTSDDVTIRGIVINDGFRFGVAVYGSPSNLRILGCFIGVNAAGTAASANVTGVYLEAGADLVVGGTDPADRNLISGHTQFGVACDSVSGVTIQGNLVGTNATGTAAIPNVDGMSFNLSGGTSLIGGTAAGAANVFSGNSDAGLFVGDNHGAGFEMNATIQGNLIGTEIGGISPLGNGRVGLDIGGSGAIVGGTGAGEANVIAYNGTSGILVSYSIFNTGVTMRGNSIHDNGQKAGEFDSREGIALGGPDPTLNDPGDSDVGPNNLQNYPVVDTVTASSVSGTLNSEASLTYTLDFYASPTCGLSGYGEGKTWLGFKDVTTNGSGDASFIFTGSIPPGQKITATATAPDGSTSEFSRCANLMPEFLDADPSPGGATNDGNGVFEPGETAEIRPNWMNPTDAAFPALTSTASGLTGPGSSTYTITDSSADYQMIPAHQTGNCEVSSNCFKMFVSAPASRPSTHWDASFTETLTSREGPHNWKLHIGDSFTDVPRSQLFYKKIETVFHNAITVGCTATTYCPEDDVPRDQMAIFLARGIAHGGGGIPVSGSVGGHAYNCVSGGVSLFSDVPPTAISCKSIHYIAAQNVTTGCTTGKYCPADSVSRSVMAIFVAKAVVAPAGGAAVPLSYTDPTTHISYSCDPASPNTYFTDVTASDAFCKHVHYLYARGIIEGCAGSQYCPDGSVSRGEMAKFLSNAFRLLLYGP